MLGACQLFQVDQVKNKFHKDYQNSTLLCFALEYNNRILDVW